MTSTSLAAEPTSPVARGPRLSWLTSFPAAIAALLIMLSVLTVRGRFADPDMWWHLKIGQVIATTHHIPTTDLFSYTTNHHATIPHEWLSELFIYKAYEIAGYSGLMFWECALTAAVLLAGFYLCTLVAGTPILGFFGALLIWFFGTVGFSVRPQIVGYLLLIFELVILQLGRSRSHRFFWLLPPLFCLWVNCHGSFLVGLLVLVASAVAESARTGRRAEAPISRGSGSVHLLIAAAACFPALLINPAGIQQALYPFQIMFHSPVNLGEVQEWRPLHFDDSRAYVFVALIAVTVLLACLRKFRVRPEEIVILAIVSFEAASHHRLLFVFGIIIAPIISRALGTMSKLGTTHQQHPTANMLLISVAFLISFFAFPSRAALHGQIEAFSPVKAVEFMRQNHLRGPLINDYTFGGYVIWAAPEFPVFVDGRTDIFEWTGVLRTFGDWATLKTPTSALLDQYGVNLCLVDKSSAIVNNLRTLPGWKEIYADDIAVVFERQQ